MSNNSSANHWQLPADSNQTLNGKNNQLFHALTSSPCYAVFELKNENLMTCNSL